MQPYDALPEAGAIAVTVLLFAIVWGALAATLVSLARTRVVALAIAAVLVPVGVVIAAIVPLSPGVWAGIALALPAVTLATLGGAPVVRAVLEAATHRRSTSASDGGARPVDADDALLVPARDGAPAHEILRGGRTIGYLERAGCVLAIIAGYPEAVAILVAVKGIGRFSELATSAARERFIVGTLASLVWAGAVGAIARLALS